MTRLFTPLRIGLLTALAATIVAGFVLVPAGVALPIHWNLVGEADIFLPREWALLIPAVVAIFVWGLFVGIDRFASAQDRERGVYITGVVFTALTALLLSIAVVTVLIGIGVAVSMVQVIALGLAVLLLVLGNVLPKSRPNSLAGIRVPSTLRSESNWQATHRLGGRLIMAGGLVLLVAALLVPQQWLFWWVIGCVLLPILAATLYSLAYRD